MLDHNKAGLLAVSRVLDFDVAVNFACNVLVRTSLKDAVQLWQETVMHRSQWRLMQRYGQVNAQSWTCVALQPHKTS